MQDLKATAEQVIQNVSFADIGKVVGPANPGNPWATTDTYLNILTQQCTEEMSDRWQNRIGGVMDDNCADIKNHDQRDSDCDGKRLISSSYLVLWLK